MPWKVIQFKAILLFLLYARDSHQGKNERRLLAALMNEYNPFERPVANESLPIEIKFGLTLQQILDVNERDQILTTNVWLRFIWFDHYLSWNESEYEGLSQIRVPADKIWVPDVLMYNSADERFDGTFHTNIVVSSTGECLWIPPGIFKSTCIIDVSNFPFDEQVCQLKFGSWTFDGFQLNLVKLWETGDVSNFMENGEWDLVDIPAIRTELFYPCCPEPFPDITFHIKMRRKTLYYNFNLVLPCILMSALTLLSFTLPPDSGEKLALGITILLSLTVFSLIISEQMPPAGVVPLIGVYYALTIVMVGISVVTTIIVLNLHHRHPDFYEMGRVTRFLFLKFLPSMLFMTNPRERKIKREAQNNNRNNELKKVGTRLANAFHNYDTYHAQGRERAYSTELKTQGKQDETQFLSVETELLLRDTNSILEELKQITSQVQDQDEENAEINDWKFAAMVVDRLCLVSFTIWTVANTIYVMVGNPLA
ncbi:neuronal acetylcholine receptor subunit alpha-7-like [Ptychodera flava]|uniref:neuronal acetylcholine receptor subunit alpha-7-like n=1 Tax=Ptychodera flava TaxID=63121 RepID=UPI003969DCCA